MWFQQPCLPGNQQAGKPSGVSRLQQEAPLAVTLLDLAGSTCCCDVRGMYGYSVGPQEDVGWLC